MVKSEDNVTLDNLDSPFEYKDNRDLNKVVR